MYTSADSALAAATRDCSATNVSFSLPCSLPDLFAYCVLFRSANGKRVERSSELSRTHVRYVNEISRLEMLKRDTTTRYFCFAFCFFCFRVLICSVFRGELIGNIVFRSLIYKDNLEWSSIDRNANRVCEQLTIS